MATKILIPDNYSLSYIFSNIMKNDIVDPISTTSSILDQDIIFLIEKEKQEIIQKDILKKDIKLKLESFAELKPNWDSYGAEEINISTVNFSNEIANELIELGVNLKFCYPLSYGGIQLEFYSNKYYIEIEVNPDYSINVLSFLDNRLINKVNLRFLEQNFFNKFETVIKAIL